MCVRENVCVCVSDVSERVNEWVNERVSEGQSREELDESGYDFGADVYCWVNEVPSRQEPVPVSSDPWIDPLPVIVKGVTPEKTSALEGRLPCAPRLRSESQKTGKV